MISTYLKAIQLGVLAGMRAAMAPAFVSHYVSHQPASGTDSQLLHLFRSSTTANVTKVMALGEIVGDKMPNTPDRIEPAGIVGRIISGATCGAVLSEAEKEEVKLGAVMGGVGAVAGSYAFFYLRKWVHEEKGIEDVWLGFAEDLLAIALGTQTIHQD